MYHAEVSFKHPFLLSSLSLYHFPRANVCLYLILITRINFVILGFFQRGSLPRYFTYLELTNVKIESKQKLLTGYKCIKMVMNLHPV